MNLISEGTNLSEIPEYSGKGQLRIYLSRELTTEELYAIQSQYVARYEARILEIDFSDGVPVIVLTNVIGWQLFSIGNVDWAWWAVAGAIAVVATKYGLSKRQSKEQ